MTKTIIIPKNLKQVERSLPYIDGLLLGIKDYSTNFEQTYTVEEIKQFIQKVDGKDILIAVNKNIANTELEGLKNILLALCELPIKGVLFYDLSILNLKEKLHLPYDLIWAQEHFTTNYGTVNAYYKEGVKGTFLSSDITKQEILEIKKNTNAYVMVTLFGYLPLFASRRHLVDNYKKTFNLESQTATHYIKKGTEKYRIIDDCHGTTVYSSHIVNGASEYPEMVANQIDYILLNGFDIVEEIFDTIIEKWSIITEENKQEVKEQIDQLCDYKTDQGFLYKETIYKVNK